MRSSQVVNDFVTETHAPKAEAAKDYNMFGKSRLYQPWLRGPRKYTVHRMMLDLGVYPSTIPCSSCL